MKPAAKGVVYYSGRTRAVTAGLGEPVRVNLSIGTNRAGPVGINSEVAKIRSVLAHSASPDLMMDLSTAKTSPEPWEVLVDEFGGPVGVLPHYLAFDQNSGLNPSRIIDRIEHLLANGVGFVTIHPTPTMSLFRRATEERATPITSRGGGIVVRDMLINKRDQSVFNLVFDEICQLAAERDAVVNLGTAFRSAGVADGLDGVTLAELERQAEFVHRAREHGTMVTLEGPGHLLMSQLSEYVRLTEPMQVPRMPLGPMVTDTFPNVDHVVNAIGAATLMTHSRGGIVNAVSRVEHLGGVPNARHLIEALDAALAAAHAATITYHDSTIARDKAVAKARSDDQTCVVQFDHGKAKGALGAPGCSRCGCLCPLLSDHYAL